MKPWLSWLAAVLMLLPLSVAAEPSPDAPPELAQIADAYLRAKHPDLWRAEVGWSLAAAPSKRWILVYKSGLAEIGKPQLWATLALLRETNEVLWEEINTLDADWNPRIYARPAPAGLEAIAQQAAKTLPLPLREERDWAWFVWDGKDWLAWSQKYNRGAVQEMGVTEDSWVLFEEPPEEMLDGQRASVVIAKGDKRVIKVRRDGYASETD